MSKWSLPVRHTDWGLRDYGTAKWEGGDAECNHRIDRFGNRTITDKTTIDQGNQKSLAGEFVPVNGFCPKCGARRIDNQLGLEATPEEYVENMVAVFREVRRVMRDDGVLWLNMGDGYMSQPAGNKTPSNWPGQTRPKYINQLDKYNTMQKGVIPGLKPKDLVGIPWRVAFALQADGWWLRSDCIWAKPNPMPESVTDRPTKSHEYVFLLTKAANYYYDQEAVREENIDPDRKSYKNGPGTSHNHYINEKRDKVHTFLESYIPGSGRNLRTVWNIATAPYSGAHFATFPPALVERCIKAGTSERGCCPVCGKAWERVVERKKTPTRPGNYSKYDGTELERDDKSDFRERKITSTATLGWRPACNHDAEPTPCVVFDPFCGSGTTVMVAQQLGRRGIGLDLSLPYLHLARERTGAAALSDWTDGAARKDGRNVDDLPLFSQRSE